MIGLAPWRIGAVVPARDEAHHIAKCIQSIRRAAQFAHCESRLWIVVVADSCQDDTAIEARRALGAFGEVLISCARSAGSARRLGAGAALAHFRHRQPERTWLCNTDADSTVPLDWIAHHLALAEQGITGIAGVVTLNAGADPLAQESFSKSYRLNPNGTHGHVHGANLALRADAYLDVGGWYDLDLAEDHCLWRRLLAKGWRVCSRSENVVTTSARLIGRARGGFADTLRESIRELRA